jgi:hypothetical protein
VLAVNGVDVRGKSAFEVSSLLQGPNETFVTIKVVILILSCMEYCYIKFFSCVVLIMIVQICNVNVNVRSSTVTVGLFNLSKSKDNLLLDPPSFIVWRKLTMVLLLLGTCA